MESPLSFSATEGLRKKLLAMNLEPYYVNGSASPQVNAQDVGTKEYQFIEKPLVNQEDLEIEGLIPQAKLNLLNQYGPEGGRGNQAIFKNNGTKTNEGEFNYSTGNTNKFKESEQKQKDLLVINRYAPQEGWTDSSSMFENYVLETDIRDEYVSDSLKPNLFRPSTYSASNIYLKTDPKTIVGSDGSLSQDSRLAQLGAEKLRKLFLETVAFEIEQETTARANGRYALTDSYLASKISLGLAPLIEPSWNITVPDSALGKVIDFASRITGRYSPFSYIPGDYFEKTQPINLLNQTVNVITGLFGFPNVLPTRKTASDIFLAYTGQGTKKQLFGSLTLNKYVPDYKLNFAGQLGLFAPKPNYYVGSRTSEPTDIVSPSGEIPVDEYGREVETNVYGPGLMANLYENDIDFKFGLNSTSTIDGGGLQGGFTWVSPKYKGNAGFRVGKGAENISFDENYQPISAQYTNSESTQYKFKKGSILDDTQRLINSQPNGAKKLQHVGNAIDQVSKVFNDGYKEITKGSKVIKYTDNNGVFVGSEYGRVFAKDIPYYENSKLQKTDGNIRKNSFSILDKTYNLNIYPTTGTDSTSVVDGKVKKYMLSIENLAWRTSRRPGLTYADLPESEKGPNGGRIMWFPPYSLKFSDGSTATWNSEVFLGRPEPIYTYSNTSRGGGLSFKIVVDHPSIMNLVVNQVLSNTNSNQLADQVLESFFAGLTKFDLYELAGKYKNFSITQLRELQSIINSSSNPEKIKNAINSNLNKGGDGSGGPMTSNSSVGIQDYKPQLTSYIGKTQFYFDYNQNGGTSYATALNAYENSDFFPSIAGTQRSEIEGGSTTLTNLANDIKKVLTTNSNIAVNVVLKSNSSFNESTSIKESRNSCIEQSLLAIIGSNSRLSFTKTTGDNNETISPQTQSCGSQVSNQYDVVPVACRRVLIQDIKETPLPNLVNPNGAVSVNAATTIGNVASQTITANQINRAATNSASNLEQTISKDVLRKLLNESNYFEFVKESNPYIYDSLREKLKYFHPAFHAITPEGLNSRLTFLNQCVRPGDTIPTKQADGTLIDKDARNTSFGAPPVCIIRVGDFYHTKAIIESVTFTYDESLDLNPEGIGVQPMIVDVSLTLKFIGGQSLRGPIEELQNALSFNFYANTEMYDERATVLDLSAYDKEFIEKTEPTGDDAKNTNTDLANEAGEFIGKLDGELKVSATTGNNSYKNVFNDLVDSFDDLYTGTYDKLKQIFTDYNWSVLQIYTTQRTYSEGDLVTSGGTKNVQIFGLSNSYKQNIDQVFNELINDIDTESLKIFEKVFGNSTTAEAQTYKNVLKTQLKQLVENKKVSFYNGLDTITQQLSQSQLKYVRVIDKLNFLNNNLDGFLDKTSVVKLYVTQSGVTIGNLLENSKQVVEGSKKIVDNYKSASVQIIPSGNSNYNFANVYVFNEFQTLPEKRFYTIFGNDLLNKYDTFVSQVVGELASVKAYKKKIEDYMNQAYKKIVSNININGNKNFNNFKKNPYDKSKSILNSGDCTNGKLDNYKKDKRENSLLIQTPQDTSKQTDFNNLYSGVNSTDNKFNLKFTF